LAIAFLISGCASQDESVIHESTTPNDAPINRPVYTPGSEGMDAGHHL